MPAIVAPFVAFALGVILALSIRSEAERYDEASRRDATRIVALFAAVVFAPVTAYFVAFASDWSLAYLADARAIPSAVGLVWVVGSAALSPLGFVVTLRASKRRARRELIALAAAPISVAVVFVVALSRELRVDATTQEVRGDFGTQPLAGSSLGWAVIFFDAMLVLGFFLARRALSPPRAEAADPASPASPAAPEAATANLDDEPPRLLGQRRSPRSR